ncbi:neutral zinc metallopeptidase [Williamsia sp.]|uniref:neutral zinc metallopeptidase n=1 Tax=Williamsia sp. TaxID=1872085 RepID=UPI001A302D78|nr:neutral zinc metallopeptidase [Williamsia sp.]MBJ7289783.1 neutral zinc metallopeptidase [Williamsia sp.]
MRLTRVRPAVVIIAAIVTIATACSSGPTGGQGPQTSSSSSNAPSVPINGDRSDPVNVLVARAIANIQGYWTTEYPQVYDGAAYEPVTGGFYAVDPGTGPLPPCAESASDIAGNAFYCATKDVVAWDVKGLLPDLRRTYGDFVIPVVLAHEWGHALQARSDFEGMTVTREIQADCFSGAWSRHAIDSDEYQVSSVDLDRALAGFLSLRDEPGTAADDPSAHGSGFDRINAFQNGYENGPTTCAGYRDGAPAVVELPFSSAADAAAGGDAPYEDIIAGVPVDLEDYWSQVYPELTGKQWTPVRRVVPFGSQAPACGDTSAEGYLLFYCVPDNYVGFENDSMQGFYDEGGDFAVAALLATQWGIAALTQMGDSSDEATSSQRADCLAGAWTASVLLQNRNATSGYSLSPGDLDEAIKALLTFRGPGDADRQGAGFVRTEAYRSGVIDGAKPCLPTS